MDRDQKRKLRKLNAATHRDLGYFFSTLIIVYCISGIALNHVDDFNPDFIIQKTSVVLPKKYSKTKLSPKTVIEFGKLVGETSYKVYDVPFPGQVKIYYDNASLHLNFDTQTGFYERVSRRPIFYQSNIIHRNSVKGWKWAADAFAVLLILISITGLFILRGKHGISGRGKWL